MDILVFKTNICKHEDIARVKSILVEDNRIKKWNVAHEDIDNVLRIESMYLPSEEVIQRLRTAGYQCEELPD